MMYFHAKQAPNQYDKELQAVLEGRFPTECTYSPTKSLNITLMFHISMFVPSELQTTFHIPYFPAHKMHCDFFIINFRKK